MDNENARLAEDLRRQLNRRTVRVLGFSLLGLGLPLGAGYLVGVLLVRISALHAVSLAGAFLLLMALASFGLVLLQRTRCQRSLALIAVADELGLSFQEVAAPHRLEGLRRLEMFSDASGIGASNVLHGEVEGLTVTVMDCIVSAGDETQQFSFENTVFVLRNVPRRVPDFYLTPNDFLSRRLSRGSQRIEVPRQPEFNKRFLLRGPDEEAIFEAFNAELIALCLAGGDQSIEVYRPLFVVRQRGQRLPPPRYRDFIRHCVRLARAVGIIAEA